MANKNPPFSAGFCEADEGTRTLDLLHGKDLAQRDWSGQEPTGGLVIRILWRHL
jgi:hypothetical protein